MKAISFPLLALFLTFLLLGLTVLPQGCPPEFYYDCSMDHIVPPTNLGGNNQTCTEYSTFGDFEDAQLNISYIPGDADSIITLRVNLLFIRDDSGFGHFDSTDTEAMQVWDDIEHSINYKYSNLSEPPSYLDSNAVCEDTYVDFIPNTNIQFDFNRVFINNTALFDSSEAAMCSAYGIRVSTRPTTPPHFPAG